jgi:hypothetical protein
MSNQQLMDKAYHFIMNRFVESGQAPHYTELAKELGMPMEDGRKTLHDLFDAGVKGWLFPNTDLITSFAPFNNLPTHYRISVEGQQRWFGQ